MLAIIGKCILTEPRQPLEQKSVHSFGKRKHPALLRSKSFETLPFPIELVSSVGTGSEDMISYKKQDSLPYCSSICPFLSLLFSSHKSLPGPSISNFLEWTQSPLEPSGCS